MSCTSTAQTYLEGSVKALYCIIAAELNDGGNIAFTEIANTTAILSLTVAVLVCPFPLVPLFRYLGYMFSEILVRQSISDIVRY